MTGRILLGRVAGVGVLVGVSWLLIAPVVGLALFAGIEPSQGALGWRIAVAAAGSAVLFASIIVHELGHVFVARRRGVAVERVVVFLFGGYSEMDLDTASPDVQVAVSVAGPLASVGLAVVLLGPALVAPRAAGIRGVAGLLAVVNVGVAVFNLLPGYPLDGGRILRALLIGMGMEEIKAERLAARIGIGCGTAVVVAGVALSIAGRTASLLIVPVGVVVVVLAAAHRKAGTRSGVEET